MTNLLRKEKLTVITAGGTSAAYGTTYSSYPIIGEIVRLNWSGAGLGGSGYFRLTESGTILDTTAFVGGSALNAGQMTWNAAKFPVFTASEGSEMMKTAGEGSIFVPYYTNDVILATVSGTNPGSLFLEIYYKDLRG